MTAPGAQDVARFGRVVPGHYERRGGKRIAAIDSATDEGTDRSHRLSCEGQSSNHRGDRQSPDAGTRR